MFTHNRLNWNHEKWKRRNNLKVFMPTVALPIQTFINVSTLSLSVTVE